MTQKILITGDIAIDHLYHTIPQQADGCNWELYESMHTTLLPGGAFVLTRFVKEAVKSAGLEAEVTGQTVLADLGGQGARNMIQAKILLARYPEDDKKPDKKGLIRVEKYYGYSAPTGETPVWPSLEKNRMMLIC